MAAWRTGRVVKGYGVRKFFRKKSTAHSPSIETTCPPSTTALTLIGRQQFSQSDTKSSSPSIPSSMTRVSELQKGQEIVVVPSNDYFPSAFNFVPVLPPCLRRRSAISGCLKRMATSSGVPSALSTLLIYAALVISSSAISFLGF